MLDLVIAMDVTGSMYSCFGQVKTRVNELVSRIFKEIPGAQVALYAVGNHNDHQPCKGTNLLGDGGFLSLTNFLNSTSASGGGGHKYGGCPACYELAIESASSLNWKNDKRVMLVIGDESPSHELEGSRWGRSNCSWKTATAALVEAHNVHLYGVHCLNDRTSLNFYKQIAKMSDGIQVKLDQFHEVVDLILAICYKQQGMSELDLFAEELKSKSKMSRSLAKAFAQLSGKDVSEFGTYTDYSQVSDDSLVPVDPSRFQVLDVLRDQDIKSFVIDSGATFRVGRGFYEWQKTEMIQERKEVVLVEKGSGDMWSGAEARNMIGLPFGERENMNPSKHWNVTSKYTVYIQSTSNNRKLTKGTKFLYELQKG